MWNVFRIGLLLLLPGAAIAADVGTAPVTFAKDIAPIFQEKCQDCHRKGTAAPMPLITYEEARPWAKSIRQRVITRNMPPWHIDKTVGIQEFQNDRSLSDAQIATIVRWVDGGSPMGDPKDLPPLKKFPEDESWQLAKVYGEPDLVLKSEPYTMPAHGQDVWFKPLTEVPLTEARWVRAVEMRPGTTAGRRIMHHVLARLIQEEPATPGSPVAAGGATAGGADAGLLMEWAIGKNYDIYRPNCGKLLLPGSHIWWELHLHAVGEEIRDHAELAVYLYPKGEVPKYRTYLTLFSATPVFGSGIDIAPNSIAQSQGYHLLRQPARLENFQPHMHLRGKAMSMEAILPDGTTRMLSYVDHFNFNWMNNYIYAEEAAPVLPKGTLIHITAWHDNTRANPNNPTRTSGWDSAIARWTRWPMPGSMLLTSATRTMPSGSRSIRPGGPRPPGASNRRRMHAGPFSTAFRWTAAGLLGGALLWPQQLPFEPPHDFGQSITGAFEGWFPNADGSFNILLGYYNRNLKQELEIPPGPDNRIDPGGPDQGQPSHFLPGRQWGVFTIRVPKDFGDKKLTWTIATNGKSTTIPMSLNPLWEVQPFREASGNQPPFIAFSDRGPWVQGPAGPTQSVTTTLPEPADLTVWVADDASVPLAGGRPRTPAVTLSWSKFRGPGTVTFTNPRPAVEQADFQAPPSAKFSGKARTSAAFSEPGEYILRLVANDWSGDGGHGFQCCWSNAQVKVSVKPARSGSRW